MKRWVEWANGWLGRRRAGVVLLALLALAYVAAYGTHELFPGFGVDAEARGWWTWADQSEYRREAEALARGEVDARSYSYPLGYAALAAPFVRWLPAHAFFVPDLALVLGAAVVWWRLARRWLSPLAAVVTAVGFVAMHGWLIADTIVVPWNTLVTLCTLSAAIWRVTAKRGPGVVWAVAMLAAATYLVRPVDALAFAPLLIVAVGRLPSWRERIAHGAGGAVVLLTAWAAVGALNVAVFGSWRTPYELTSLRASGFFGYPVSWKAFWLFLDGLPFFGEVEPGLAWRYPWLWLLGPAALWWIRREGAAGAAGVGAVAVSVGTYVNYNDLLPSDLYRFTLVHYLVWWFPLMFLVVIAACRNGWRDPWMRGGFGVAFVLAFVGAGLRLEPRMEKLQSENGAWRLPDKRPLIVELGEVPKEAVKQLRLDGRALVEPAEHVVPMVGAEFRVMLGDDARGETLTLAKGVRAPASAEVGELKWTWRMSGDRARKIVRRIFWHVWR